jgi:sugar/nucleoside kinase (ribokinase family)
MFASANGPEERASVSFDVICMGEVLWKLADPRRGLRPSGGAIRIALELAKSGMRVGLATVVPDDTSGRSSMESLAAAGVDVGGVRFSRRSPRLVVVDASGGTRAARRVDEDEHLVVPSSWSASVLVMSGLSPVVAHAAAMCRAARAARRAGSLVLIDFEASLHAWAGRDPRTIRMVLREVDAARCSVADLAVLGMDLAAVREAVRPGAVVVITDPSGGAMAAGPFGEVACAGAHDGPLRGLGSVFTAALTRSLARAGAPEESVAARWQRALAEACRAIGRP